MIDGCKGRHYLHVASWKRENLNTLIKTLSSDHNTIVSSITMTKHLPSTFLFNTRPDLTIKQREAIELAILNGYYEVPRKTSVEQLAGLSGRTFSTFQVHLRKAEKKIIPSIITSDTYR